LLGNNGHIIFKFVHCTNLSYIQFSKDEGLARYWIEIDVARYCNLVVSSYCQIPTKPDLVMFPDIYRIIAL